MADISVTNSNLKVCEILGIDPGLVTSIEIKLSHDAPPTAYVEMAVTEDNIFAIAALCGTVKKFKAV